MKRIAIILAFCLLTLPSHASVLYEYDARGRLTSVLYDNGSRLNYTYDDNGNVISVETTESGLADLGVTLVADSATPSTGVDLTYTATLTNVGPDSTPDAQLTFTTPNFVTVRSATATIGTCVGTDPVVCDIGYLGNGAISVVTIVVEPFAAGMLSAAVTVGSGVTDSVPGNDTDSVDLTATDEDADGDGVFNSEELLAPGGDGNGDGIPDRFQPTVATVVDGGRLTTVEVVNTVECPQLTSVDTVDPVLLGDAAYFYPRGMVVFSVACESATVRLTYQNAPSLISTVVRTFGNVIPGDSGSVDWFNRDDSTILEEDPPVIELVLTDAAPGDDSGDDGVIDVAPTGPGYVRPTVGSIPEVMWDTNDVSIPMDYESFTVYPMPFNFPFEGRTITSLGINNHGIVELLEAAEMCQTCDSWRVAQNIFGYAGMIDAIFAASGQHTSSVVVDSTATSVEITWMSLQQWIYGNPVDHYGLFSVTLHDDGTIVWDYFDMGFEDGFGGELLTGFYDINDSDVTLAHPDDEFSPVYQGDGVRLTYTYTPGVGFSSAPMGEDEISIPFTDDGNASYTMPFLFPYFGLRGDAIDVNTNGSMEVLLPGEPCYDCLGTFSHAAGIHYMLQTASLFGANDDLATAVAIRDRGFAVDVHWFGGTLSDADPLGQPMTYGMRLYDNGQVLWRFYDMDYTAFGGDLFSGVFDPETFIEMEIEGGTDAFSGPQVNRAFLLTQPINLYAEAEADTDLIEVGEETDVTFIVGNSGALDATGVAVDITLLPELEIVNMPGSCTQVLASAQCSLGTVPGASEVNLVFTLRGIAAASDLLSASVSGLEVDHNDADNDAFVGLTVLPLVEEADLAVTVNASPTDLMEGEQVTYSLTALNYGIVDALNARVSLTLPVGMVATLATPSAGTCSIAADQVVCEIGTLAVAMPETISVDVTANAAGVLTNEARVTGWIFDPNPFDDFDTAQVTVMAAPPMDGGPTDGGPMDGGPADGGPMDGGPGDSAVPGDPTSPGDTTAPGDSVVPGDSAAAGDPSSGDPSVAGDSETSGGGGCGGCAAGGGGTLWPILLPLGWLWRRRSRLR